MSTGFSLAQQLVYRKLVARAWLAVSKRTGAPLKDAKLKDAWTRSKLEKVTGQTSTKEVNARQHYAAIMAEFEAEAADSVHWQLRAYGGTAAEQSRRLLHKIAGVCKKHDLDEHYARGVMRQSLSLHDPDPTPSLDRLTPEMLIKVLNGLKAAAKHMEAKA